MKTMVLGVLMAAAAATAAFAGDVVVEPDASSDATGAFVLLALTAIVIASGAGAFASRGKTNALDIKADEAQDDPSY
jgi:opacity protein-like surface antigen